MPDEYLPPNRVLFIQNLPVEVTKEVLTELFGQYVCVTFVNFIMSDYVFP